MTKPFLSIITPMYKGAALVGDTIDSVLRQSFTDWEMIVVDDCSPDDGAGASVVQAYCEKDTRIKLIRLQTNKGSSGARNEGLRAARGQYIAFLDSDDIWHDDYLATMMRHIEENKNEKIAVFFSGYKRMDSTCTKELLEPYVCEGVKDYDALLYHCPIFPSVAIYDRSKLTTQVFFREELRNLRDDYVFWLDILSQGLLCEGYSEILADYRMRDDSLTASKKKMIYPQWNIYRNVLHMNFFKSAFYLCSWAWNGIKKYGKM